MLDTNTAQNEFETMDERYQRAQHLLSGILNNKLTFNDLVFPVWIKGRDCFHYERTLKQEIEGKTAFGKEFRLVDAKAATNDLAFDHAVFASALAKASKGKKSGQALKKKVEKKSGQALRKKDSTL